MFHDARRRFPSAPMIVLCCPLLAWLLLTGFGLFDIRFRKRRRRRFQFFQFLNALLGGCQLLLEPSYLLQGLLEALF
ncbi:MAG TPA: hypothetical protein VJO32_15285 [Ktedonobacteraceae bacterium]|nr:hypothetical protein [Ktedonobacteraceae bacterium]